MQILYVKRFLDLIPKQATDSTPNINILLFSIITSKDQLRYLKKKSKKNTIYQCCIFFGNRNDM